MEPNGLALRPSMERIFLDAPVSHTACDPPSATHPTGGPVSPPPPFRSDEDAWEQRAKIAKWAAEELEACGRTVAGLLASNYMGDGCVEAPPVHTDLRNSISTGPTSWSEKLGMQAGAMSQLAAACAGSKVFTDQDALGAHLVGE
jgi:hypothetical protein